MDASGWLERLIVFFSSFLFLSSISRKRSRKELFCVLLPLVPNSRLLYQVWWFLVLSCPTPRRISFFFLGVSSSSSSPLTESNMELQTCRVSLHESRGVPWRTFFLVFYSLHHKEIDLAWSWDKCARQPTDRPPCFSFFLAAKWLLSLLSYTS